MFTEAWPPQSGGVATSAHRIATSLASAGRHQVTVFTFDSSLPVTSPPSVTKMVSESVSVLKFGPFFLKRPSDELSGINEKHRAILRRQVFDQMAELVGAMPEKPDVMFSMYVVNAGWLATYLANHIGIPHVLGIRGNDVGRNIFSVDRLYPVALSVKSAAAIVCVNRHLKERVLLAFPEVLEKVRIIGNSCLLPDLTTSDRPASRNELLRRAAWPTTTVIVSFIGAAREKKGIRALLASLLEPSCPSNLRLAVIGTTPTTADKRLFGDMWRALEHQGRLYCSGQMDRTAALNLAFGSDIGTMPSIEDGLANGLLESMALGIPVVVSDLFADVVEHQKSGIVVRRNDIAGLTAAFTMLGEDQNLRFAMGAAAKARTFAQYSPHFEATKYEEVFLCVQKQFPCSAHLKPSP